MQCGLGYAFTEDTMRAQVIGLIMRFLYRIAYSVSETVIFHNPDDQFLARDEDILPDSTPSVVVNGSGVDTSYFTPAPLPEAPVFLCMARLLARKGIREYVEAARRVKAEYPDAVFQLAGGTSPEPNSITREELHAWEEEGTIEYLGYVDDVREALAGASVYVLPSYREGTPRSVLEAMAMGRPIITTDAPGCRETVEPGENGWLVPPRTSEELVDAMRWIIEHPERKETMGQRSRERATELYDVRLVNRSTMRAMGLDPEDEPIQAGA